MADHGVAVMRSLAVQHSLVRKRYAGDADEWPAATQVADRWEPPIARAVRDILDRAVAGVNVPLLRAHLLAGDPVGMETAFPTAWLAGALRAELAPMLQRVWIAGVGLGASPLTAMGMPIVRAGVATGRKQFGIDLEATEAEGVAWTREHTAALVIASAAFRALLRQLVDDGRAAGVPIDALVRQLRETMGLDAPRARALVRFAAGLQQANVAPDLRERRVARYAAALRRQRAVAIARTETISALTGGQLRLWDRAVAVGWIRPTRMVKQWIVTPDDVLCVRCESLTEQVADIGANFPGGVAGPPLHPHCRCAIGLIARPS